MAEEENLTHEEIVEELKEMPSDVATDPEIPDQTPEPDFGDDA